MRLWNAIHAIVVNQSGVVTVNQSSVFLQHAIFQTTIISQISSSSVGQKLIPFWALQKLIPLRALLVLKAYLTVRYALSRAPFLHSLFEP